MDMYYGCNQFEFPPHIYALAENAMRSLTEHNLNQCIIISGESGASDSLFRHRHVMLVYLHIVVYPEILCAHFCICVRACA